MYAVIFDIQRFSLHDGPGIRTTVFFKGCNLRCLWCHNPESQSPEPELMFYADKCTGCGKCRAFCEKAFTELCERCGKCASVCPCGAKEQSGRKEEVKEIVKTALRDIPFYKTSGGGVTLSGGEPLLQADACAEILRECKKNGVHTAVETAGNVPFSAFEKLLPHTDLFLFDLKGINPVLHKQNVGVSNSLILENAGRLSQTAKDVRFRMPYIPGYNSDEVFAVCEFVRALDKPLELMAYHDIGTGKYASLGREYSLKDVRVPSAREMENLARELGVMFNPAFV
ncbi:MAG: glycyl-radical enzyme activating protein [Clostridia bacterium]|nr:glycyl-radical enzyme activating protein [Clostridia bacterium]